MGIPMEGEYTWNGVTKKCEKYECIGLYDIGRGVYSYHTNWFWATVMTYVKEENGRTRTFALNFGDGIGTEYKTKDKSYEDFVIIDGKHYKLDQTRMNYSADDYTKTHTFKTIGSDKVFP
jgi:hypothetical protein